MSKLASKLSRQIMAAVLSFAMILPNMTVYASEVSVPETQEEITVDNGELNVEQPSLTEEETLPDNNGADEDPSIAGEDSDDGVQSEESEEVEEPDSGDSIVTNSKSRNNTVLEAVEPLQDVTRQVRELKNVTRVYNLLTDHYNTSYTDDITSPDGKLVISGGQRSPNSHGIVMKRATITIDVYAGETIYIGGCYHNNPNTYAMVNGDENDKIELDTMAGVGCSSHDKTTDPTINDANNVNYLYTGTSGEWGKVVLQFSDGSMYVPYIIVAGQEPEPTVTEVTANITFDADTKAILGDADVIKLVNVIDDNDSHEITSAKDESGAKAFTLKPNSTYKIVSENPDIEALTSDGKSTVLVQEAETTFTVKFAKTVVEPTVIYDIDSSLTKDDITLTLTNTAVTTDTITLTKTDNEKVKLKIGATYELSCSYTDASVTLDATINNGASLEVDSTLTAITIAVVKDDNAVQTTQVTRVYNFMTDYYTKSADVISPDGKLEIKGGKTGNDHGTQMLATVEIEVYPGEKIYIARCKHNPSGSKVTIKESDDDTGREIILTGAADCSSRSATQTPTVNDQYAVNYTYTGTKGNWGKATLTFTNSPYVSYIIVAGKEPESTVTEVKANITFDADTKDVLGASDEIKLVNVIDENDSRDITSAKTAAAEFTLTPNSTYKIVSTNPDIEALTSDGKSTVLVREADTQFTVKFTKTVVTSTVAYDIATGLTASNLALTLVNVNDNTDTISLTQAADETVKLKIGATYKVTYSYADTDVTLIATINNAARLEIDKTLSAITIKVVEDNSGPTIQRTTTYSFYHGTDATATKYGTCILNPHDQSPLNFTSRDGLLTLKGGKCHDDAHGLVLSSGSTITIHVLGKAKVTLGGCQYGGGGSWTMVSKPADGPEAEVQKYENGKTSGCFHSNESNALVFEYDEAKETDLVITAGGELYVPVIIVERTEPEPDKDEIDVQITLNDDDNMLQDTDTVKLVEKGNANATPIDITDAKGTPKTIQLPIYSTYNIVSSNPDISATTEDGYTDIMTGTQDMEVKIGVTSTVVHPTVRIKRSSSVAADTALGLKLVNMADSTDEVNLVDGETIKLTIGAIYRIVSSAAVTATIDNADRLTVDKTLTKINVKVTAPDTSVHTIDVWDFGAATVANTATATYNNKLTADIINAWYPGVTAGSENITLPADGIEVKDANGQTEIYFNTNAKLNHRLRTTNTALTRYDTKTLTDLDDNTITYTGNIYSNSAKEPNVYMQVAVKAGDKVTFAVSSNGGSSTLNWQAPSGRIDGSQTFTGKSSDAQRMTFYAKEDGNYRLYSATEKLVVARIYRERPGSTDVSGSLTLPSNYQWNNSAKLVFTNTVTGQRNEAAVTDNDGELSYTVKLLQQYSYNVSLEGLEGCIVDANNELDVPNGVDTLTFDVNTIAIDLVEVSGSLAALTKPDLDKLSIQFVNEDQVFVPTININKEDITYSAKLEKDVEYDIVVADVNDYELETLTISAAANATDKNIVFTKKPVWPITVTISGPTTEEAAGVELTFTNVNEEGYVYTYTGTDGIALRNGQYAVKAVLEGYTQKITSDLKVNDAAVSKTIVMTKENNEPVAYKATITVGTDKEYTTVNDALDAVRRMDRPNDERVTIAIDPGDYEEMLVVKEPNVTLKNASATPSIGLTDKGVHIDSNAVRITAYYGHGYTYYSMGPDCKWDGDLLEANKENGYASYTNPGAGSTDGSYWNASVVIDASGFQADGIIFENSFNQYVSKKAKEDVIVAQSSASEGGVPRAELPEGSVAVQDKAYVERAAALAITNKQTEIFFNNCKFVGRQDTLYGGENVTAAFYDCSIYGGTDFIMGRMTAVFAKCDLVMNTMENNNDVSYVTAAQQKAGVRGYLMYNCEITSTTPGVDTNSAQVSKPGYFGRPWEGKTSETVFYYTIIDTASDGTSLIKPIGWSPDLGGAAKAYEYGTYERTAGTDNSAGRIDWSTVLTRPVIDNKPISVESFLGTWNPFDGKDMTIRLPDGTEISEEDAIYEVIDAPTANPAGDSEVKTGTKVTLGPTADDLKIYYSMAADEAPATPAYDDDHLYTEPIPLAGDEGDEIYITAVTVKYNTDGSMKDYSDPVVFKYTIKNTSSNPSNPEEDDSGLTVQLDPKYIPEGGYVYTGNAITPVVIVKNNNIPLTEGVDYTIKYTNNKNANKDKAENKRAKITVTGKGSFTGKATTTFVINPKSLAKDDVQGGTKSVIAGDITVVKNKKVTPVLVYNGIKLTAKDYKFADGSNTKFDSVPTDPTTAVVTVEGKGNFTGTLPITVRVVEKNSDLKKITVKLNKNSYPYTGAEVYPDYTVKSGSDTVTNTVTDGTDMQDKFIVTYNTGLINAGTVKFTVIGMGEYTGTVTKSYKITPDKSASITAALKDGANATYTYVSTGVTVPDEDITVTIGSGNDAKTLVKGVDYKVAYSGNKKVTKGNAKAKCNITFIGNYKGCRKQTLPFAITPAVISNETVDVVATDKVFKNTGIYKSVPLVINKADGTLLKKSDYTVAYYIKDSSGNETEMKGSNKVTAAGTTISVKVTGKGNYEATEVSGSKVCATGEYTVCDKADSVQDLSTAKIEFYVKGETKKTTKIGYTGKPIEFNVSEGDETPNYELKVMIGKGQSATEVPKDKYDIIYANNKNKGKATVVIVPKANTDGSAAAYVGGKTATFNIVSQKVDANLLGRLFGGTEN